MLTINLNDSSLWTPVWQLDILAQSGNDGKHIPIPEQICPFLLNKPVLAVSATNPLGKPGWLSAGFLTQNIKSPLIVGGVFNTHVTSRRIILGQTQIVPFLDVQVADYAVAFRPRYWHKQIKLVVWEYQGSVSQS